MHTVTGLQPQKRAKERVNVFLDGEFAFGLALHQANELNVGQVLSASDVARLREGEEVGKAYEKVLGFLAHRPRSEAEVSMRLVRYGLSKEVAQVVLQRLRTANLIDDVVFAEFWVDNRRSFRPRGRRALRVELRRKGILDEVIEDVLENVDELADARRATSHQASRLRGVPLHERRKKLREFLMRRGFEYEVVSDAIDELVTR